MTTATVGARYQIVIPKAVRRKFDLRPQSRVRIESRQDCIVIHPAGAAKLRGIGVALTDGTDAADYVKKLRAEWGRQK